MRIYFKGFLIFVLCFAVNAVSAEPNRGAVMDAEFEALVDLEMSSKIQENAQNEVTLADGRAYVYKVEGRAVLVKADSPVESQVKVGDLIEVGDRIMTEKKSVVTIAFDMLKKNAVQIPSQTRAVFNSIEPTDIRLEDGTVFSAVDGLPKGSTWKVSTPSAVAAVRGTVYLVKYEASNGDFFAATVDVPDDGKDSAIDIQPLHGAGGAFVPEGKEINLREGQSPSNDMVQDLKPEAVSEIRQFFEKLKVEREERSKNDGGNNNPGGGNDGGTPPNGPRGPGSSGTLSRGELIQQSLMGIPNKTQVGSDAARGSGLQGIAANQPFVSDKGFDGALPPADSFDRIDRFDGSAVQVNDLAGGFDRMERLDGTLTTNYLPPLDQTQLPGSVINDPQFCPNCHPIGSCLNGRLPDGTSC